MDLQTFMGDFMNHDDLRLLTKDASLLFGCPAMVVDMAFGVVSWYGPADFDDPPFRSSIERGSLTYETGSFLIGSDAQPHDVTLKDSPYKRRFSLLVTGGVPVGYLILVDVEDKLGFMEPHMFSPVESALAKQLMLETNRGSSMQTTEESVLQHLLEGKFADEALFEAQIAAAGLQYFAPRRLALVNMELYHNTNWTENALRSTLLDYFPKSKPLIHNGSVVFFLNSDPDLHLFQNLSKQFSLRVVISEPIPRLFRLSEIYAASHALMDTLLPKYAHPFAALYEPYHALMLLKRLKDAPVLPAVAALGERDKVDETLYVLTLYTYLACHHSLQETCERLYTHRNTVLYRVRRIREDFGIPIDDPDQHLSLLLSAALTLIQLGKEDALVPGIATTKE